MNKEFRFNCIWNDKEHTDLYAITIEYHLYDDDFREYSTYLVNDDCVHIAMIDDIESFSRRGYKHVDSIDTWKGE